MGGNRVFAALLGLIPMAALSAQADGWIKGRYWLFLDNIKAEVNAQPQVMVWVALPQEHLGQQVKIGEIKPAPKMVYDDKVNGNKIVFWLLDDFSQTQSAILSYDFEILPSLVETHVDPTKLKAYDKDSAEYKRYTISEPWIELTPEIKAKAQEIVGEETNPYLQTHKIYEWVINNISYEYPEMEVRGAEKSYARHKGDCGEFSAIFCALCRSLGIPARTITCMWFTSGGHVWAEFLAPPYGWIPVDTSMANVIFKDPKVMGGKEGSARLIEQIGYPVADPEWLFGNLYPKRMIVCIGYNPEVPAPDGSGNRIFRFMQPGDYGSHPPAIEFKNTNKDTVGTSFYLWGEDCDNLAKAQEKAELNMTESYYQAGLYDKAEAGFIKKLALNPLDEMSWLQLGTIHMSRENWDKALDAFDQALAGKAGSIKPVLDVQAHLLKGNCYDALGMRDKALVEYQVVIDSGVDFMGAQGDAQKYIKDPYKGEEK
jgi:tetratricopeptide (TPR) repeat protein